MSGSQEEFSDEPGLAGHELDELIAFLDSAVNSSTDLKPLESSSGSPKNNQGVPSGQTFEDRKQKTRSHAALDLDDHKSKITMRTVFGYVIIVALIVQLISVNAVFWRYGEVRDWGVPDKVMLGWFTSTIIQVVGVAFVVAEYLFKGQAQTWSDAASADG